jgi:hypothetical protein
MKPYALFLALVLGFLGLALPLRSQVARPATSIQQLQSMKEANAKLLEQQEATLLKLDEIQKNAEQLKIFARRT